MARIVSCEQVILAKISAIEEYLIGGDESVQAKLKELEDKHLQEILNKERWGVSE